MRQYEEFRRILEEEVYLGNFERTVLGDQIKRERELEEKWCIRKSKGCGQKALSIRWILTEKIFNE